MKKFYQCIVLLILKDGRVEWMFTPFHASLTQAVRVGLWKHFKVFGSPKFKLCGEELSSVADLVHWNFPQLEWVDRRAP